MAKRNTATQESSPQLTATPSRRSVPASSAARCKSMKASQSRSSDRGSHWLEKPFRTIQGPMPSTCSLKNTTAKNTHGGASRCTFARRWRGFINLGGQDAVCSEIVGLYLKELGCILANPFGLTPDDISDKGTTHRTLEVVFEGIFTINKQPGA